MQSGFGIIKRKGNVTAHYHDYLHLKAASFAHLLAGYINTGLKDEGYTASASGAQVTVSAPAASAGQLVDIGIVAYGVENEGPTDENTDVPDALVDRGMFVTALGRMAMIDASQYTDTPFDDVTQGLYCAPYAAWAAENGIAKGVGDGVFEPMRRITRQEMATMLSGYIAFAEIELDRGNAASFTDEAEIAGWAKDGVYALAGAGLLNGVGDGAYAPARTATRAEAAALLARFMQRYDPSAAL
jgi:hypothetical protein